MKLVHILVCLNLYNNMDFTIDEIENLKRLLASHELDSFSLGLAMIEENEALRNEDVLPIWHLMSPAGQRTKRGGGLGMESQRFIVKSGGGPSRLTHE